MSIIKAAAAGAALVKGTIKAKNSNRIITGLFKPETLAKQGVSAPTKAVAAVPAKVAGSPLHEYADGSKRYIRPGHHGHTQHVPKTEREAHFARRQRSIDADKAAAPKAATPRDRPMDSYERDNMGKPYGQMRNQPKAPESPKMTREDRKRANRDAKHQADIDAMNRRASEQAKNGTGPFVNSKRTQQRVDRQKANVTASLGENKPKPAKQKRPVNIFGDSNKY